MEKAEPKRRKGSKHDKTGCLTCRYRYDFTCRLYGVTLTERLDGRNARKTHFRGVVLVSDSTWNVFEMPYVESFRRLKMMYLRASPNRLLRLSP